MAKDLGEAYRRWQEAYRRWQDDCLQEYLERYGHTQFGGPRYHSYMEPPEGEEEAWLVEFSDDGAAYPHGIGGVAYIPNAVTPWRLSPHYVE